MSGVPKFKKKGKDDSFTLDGSISVGFNHIKLPRIGWMKTYEVRIDNVSPKSVTIANTSTSVIPIITVKTKNTSGDAFLILANTPIPVGATLVLDSEALASTAGLLTITVAVLTGTPTVQAKINI